MSDAALLLAAAAILAVSLAQSASVYFGELISVRLSSRVEVESMWDVLAKLLTLPVGFFDRNSQADVVMASYYDLKGIRSVTIEMGRLVLYVSRIAGLGGRGLAAEPEAGDRWPGRGSARRAARLLVRPAHHPRGGATSGRP